MRNFKTNLSVIALALIAGCAPALASNGHQMSLSSIDDSILDLNLTGLVKKLEEPENNIDDNKKEEIYTMYKDYKKNQEELTAHNLKITVLENFNNASRNEINIINNEIANYGDNTILNRHKKAQEDKIQTRQKEIEEHKTKAKELENNMANVRSKFNEWLSQNR
jgi:capsule polysaccharide export protein KpsE/RkpR